MKLVLCLFTLVLATTSAKPVKPPRNPMYNPDLYQGDILLAKGQDRNAVPTDEQRWVGGVIPYVFDSGLSSKTRRLVLEAMAFLSRRTCLSFVRRTNQHDYVKIFHGDGCYANWGRVGGEQVLSLESGGCDFLGTAIHEILHTVGFDHEHCRNDRDNYINIYWDNIEEENYDQFEKNGYYNERRFTPFDYDSIMLYGSTAFVKDYGLLGMVKKDGGILEEPYDKVHASASDIKRVNMLYKCN